IFIPFISLPKWFFRIVTILLAAGLILITAASFFLPAEPVENTGSAVSAEDEQEYMSALTEVYSSGNYGEILDARQNLEDPFFTEEMEAIDGAGVLILLIGMLMPA